MRCKHSHHHSLSIYNSSLSADSFRSGMAMILTTRLVHPVKCWVLWPLPVSGLYCSHAKPVSFQLLYTVSTRFWRRSVYSCLARFWCGPFAEATFCVCKCVTGLCGVGGGLLGAAEQPDSSCSSRWVRASNLLQCGTARRSCSDSGVHTRTIGDLHRL